MGAKILVVDDDANVQTVLMDMLQSLGHDVVVTSDGEQGLQLLKVDTFDILLLDLNLPNMDGIEMLRRSKELQPSLAVILFSGYLSISDAVSAMKLGAFHCLTKPVSIKELDRCIQQASQGLMLHREIRFESMPDFPMVVASPSMKNVSELVQRVGQSPASTVLILGETGTGKEVVSRHLHHYSERRNENFVAVNCAAIPESLIESELFGHERGAFTDAKAPKQGLFEEANKGTLFLDEVGELPLAMQAKLLRVLQERKLRRVGGTKDIQLDVRIIAATNVNLKDMVTEGKFREDLYYRLFVIPIILPPLRERTEDIVALAEHFCKVFAKEFNRPVKTLTVSEKDQLLKHSWPGNIRELRNCIERAVLLNATVFPAEQHGSSSGSTRVLKKESSTTSGRIVEPVAAAVANNWTLSLEDPSLAAAERALIMHVLDRVSGNKNQAAALLGINRTTLYRKLSSYGMEVVEEPSVASAEGVE